MLDAAVVAVVLPLFLALSLVASTKKMMRRWLDRRRFLRLPRLSSSNTTSTNSMEEFPFSKFNVIISLTKLIRESSTGLGRLYPWGTLSNIKSIGWMVSSITIMGAFEGGCVVGPS